MKKNNADLIINELNRLYPNAYCELKHSNNFELLIAVCLSAQTTDQKVNSVTPFLFKKYPTCYKLSKAKQDDVEKIIQPIGLYRNKAKNIINLSKILVDDFKGEVPSTRKDLEALPGVGRKTCNIILSNCFDVPAFAVDTHVQRVSKRLKIANIDDDTKQVEEKLMKYFPKDKWGKLHHQFIFFGRYKCKAIKPDCLDCPFCAICGKVS